MTNGIFLQHSILKLGIRSLKQNSFYFLVHQIRLVNFMTFFASDWRPEEIQMSLKVENQLNSLIQYIEKSRGPEAREERSGRACKEVADTGKKHSSPELIHSSGNRHFYDNIQKQKVVNTYLTFRHLQYMLEKVMHFFYIICSSYIICKLLICAFVEALHFTIQIYENMVHEITLCKY